MPIRTISGEFTSNTETESIPWNFAGDGVEIVDDTVTSAVVIALEPDSPFETPGAQA